MSEDGSKRSDPDSSSHEYINFIPEYVLKFKNIQKKKRNNLSAYIFEDITKYVHFQKNDGVYINKTDIVVLWTILLIVEIDYTFG